ncbi:tetratricopeptide repeat protein [Actinocorallia sp. API 0066]|uniref:AfsR/SARP family transcriptional regulator n=1 Tax=Actinocorallia sp. API 0066 TaxID=2896846 RepID=UPI001E56E604|nr:BTAD domain-containing putative transcriptional regulator [Actinocorallia sp. API 0066]MCD0448223.1 tetratricopeptide repeat protein [Actinocorallia sp. API 0066]
MPKLDIGILGPLRVVRDDEPISLPPRSERLLVVLVAGAATGVSDERLVQELWQRDPPPTAAQALRVRIHELRRWLGSPDRIERVPGGYRLRLADGELDAARFAALAAEGAWHEAERLWRGPAYLNHTDSPLVGTAALQLDEQRIEVTERRVRAELTAAGAEPAAEPAAALVPELRALIREHPYREKLWEQLMFAQYLAGRQAEALETYQEARRLLVEEVGLEPGPALRTMEQRILTEDPALIPGSPAPRAAAELPHDTPLIGRRAESERLIGALTGPGPAIVTISGPGGAGKSVLAVHVCHRLADRFPDGRLYVDLRGATPGAAPRTTTEVLGRMLRSVGAPGRQRGDDDEDAARFRSITHDRRILILLDNAADARQVAPLLPGGPGCGVVVTSRRPLRTLPAATHLPLGVLSPADSVALLAQTAGPERVAAEPDAAHRLAALCGGLPLALRIVGSRLAAHPERALAGYAHRLDAAQHLLDELDHQNLSVRTSIAIGCQDLQRGPAERDAVELLAYLGLWDGADITGAVAAALTGWESGRAEQSLDVLTEAQLLTAAPGCRHVFHDLVRLYARELSAEVLDETARAAALGRLARRYLADARNVARAAGAPTPATGGDSDGMADTATALAWVRAERANLLAAARHAAADLPEAAVGLAAALPLPFKMHGWYRELAVLGRLAVRAARRRDEQATALLCLGTAEVALGQVVQGIGHLKEAIAHWRAHGDGVNEAITLVELARAHSANGQDRLALRRFQESLDLSGATGDRRCQIIALLYLATHHLRARRMPQAHAALRDATARCAADERRMLGAAQGILAAVHHHSGDPHLALPLMRGALDLLRESEDSYLQARAEWGLGQIHADLGDGEAVPRYARALDLLVSLALLNEREAETIAHDPVRVQDFLPDFVVTGFPDPPAEPAEGA